MLIPTVFTSRFYEIYRESKKADILSGIPAFSVMLQPNNLFFFIMLQPNSLFLFSSILLRRSCVASLSTR